MLSLSVALPPSRLSLFSSQQSLKNPNVSLAPSGASTPSSSASSSRVSLDLDDEENVTITANRTVKKLGKQKSQEDLHLLAISTHMTELSYSISDIQTRIFEIQELRHKSQSSSADAASMTTSIIDQALLNLDERLETVAAGMKSINDSLQPFLQARKTPTVSRQNENNNAVDIDAILRKHAALGSDWDAVQDESEVLREELKEDKWLTVFRTVTDQADGMMSSLEKAVNRCQDFIWQVHRHGVDESQTNSLRSNKSPVNIDVFNSLLESYDAKKKHYVPATSKVLSIIDKGVQDRVTKNGETLRRHAESAQRWKNLRERMTRTDAEMETVRKILLGGETPSENGSHTSGNTSLSAKSGLPGTPPSNSKLGNGKQTLSRSMSPLRKFARKITRSSKQPASPVTPLTIVKASREPSSEPVHILRRQRTSVLPMRDSQLLTPVTPERLGHRYSHSLTPDSSPRAPPKTDVDSLTLKGRHMKQPWNSSTKLTPDERASTLKATPPRRPSALGLYNNNQSDDIPPVPPLGAQYNRSASRASMSSSRPWTPLTSSVSTIASSNPSFSLFRSPSRAQTPSHVFTPITATTPRPRPKTPSHIPAPAKSHLLSGRNSEAGFYDEHEGRSLSPALSTTGRLSLYPPRPPSRSMIPVPSLQFPSSRPSSAMSHYGHSPGFAGFRSILSRAQTPEPALRARAQQVPFYITVSASGGRTARTSLPKAPPSSFRDASVTRTSGGVASGSRPSSRAGAYTPLLDHVSNHHGTHRYVCGNPKDPLDVEIAAIVNSMSHGLLVERVDPPLRTIPKEGEEVRAQYAFTNSLSRKVVTCRLTTMTRSGPKANGDMTTKKVMCRVGGGWQDLQLYMLSRLDV